MSDNTNKLWDEYIRWSSLSAGERGAVATKAEWARSKGVTDRTLRRWEQDPRFVARAEELAADIAEGRLSAAAVVVDAEGTPDESDYRLVKSQLVEGAKQGNQKMMDLYFRTYGKQFVEEEAASRVSDFASMDLDALLANAAVALGEDVLVEHLRSRGWVVERA